MTLRRIVVLAVSEMVLLVVTAGMAAAQGTGATAELKDPKGKDVGSAQFTEDPKGVEITAQVKGLDPGEHGIHIHEKGDCSSSDFKSAGEHFNPGSTKHGLENTEGPHAGDLPDLTVNEDGTGKYQATTDRVTLSSGKTSLFDSDGSALVVHEKADDQKTDPSGDSGSRIACGEIKEAKLPASGGINVSLITLLGVAGLGVGIFLWRHVSHS